MAQDDRIFWEEMRVCYRAYFREGNTHLRTSWIYVYGTEGTSCLHFVPAWARSMGNWGKSSGPRVFAGWWEGG